MWQKNNNFTLSIFPSIFYANVILNGGGARLQLYLQREGRWLVYDVTKALFP